MTRVTFVGTSDAFGAGGRRQSAILVEAEEHGLLLDCAPTTGTGLAALGIPRDRIDTIVISHFHADHFGGLPQMFLALCYEDRREKPLRVVGPPEVEVRVREVCDALGYALNHPLPFPLRFAELSPDRALDLGPFRTRSFDALHQPDTNPLGILLETRDSRIAFSGDTGWFENLPEQVRGADLFICECTLFEEEFEFHLNYTTLKARLREFDCKRMILTHLGSEMSARRGTLELETADDGLVLEL